MKNILLPDQARFQHLRNTLFLISFLAISSLVTLYLAGCASGPTTPGGGAGTQTTTIYGRVLDESGAPVAGVSLAGGTGVATSDVNGFFIMKNATVPIGRAAVIAKKAGYFTAAHAEVPNAKGTRIDLNMMSDATTGTVAGTTGGIANAGGASVNFAAGSFTDASGAAYTGQVKVSARYLDTRNANFFDFFDGDMMAQRVDGSGASLISAGVLKVELKDGNGNALKLDPTKPATLNYPKSPDAKAPVTMPLWYFDETLGMWKENGSATLSGNMYTGTVTHFTNFNLDYIDSTGGFNTSGTVSLRVACNGIPISGVVITIVGDDGGGKYFVHPGGKTDVDGKISFIRFPANRPVQVTVRADKNNGLYFMNNPITVNITPGETKDLGDISLDSPCPAGITGTITDCNGAKAEGLVTITDGTYTFYTYTTTGDFTAQAASGSILTITAMDEAGNVSAPTTIPALASGQMQAIGSIKVCGTNPINFIDIPLVAKNEGERIAFSPDGSRLAVWEYGTSQLSVYDTKTGTAVCQGTMTGQIYAYAIHMSSDAKKVLVVSNPTMLYDVSGATPTQITTVNGSSSELYDDGSAIIASAFSGGIYNFGKYSATSGNLISTINPTGITDSSSAYGLIADEEAMVYADQKTQGIARVWSIATNAELRNFAIIGQPYSFSTSDDGLEAGTTADYHTFSFYNTKTGQKTNTIAVSNTSTVYQITMTKNFAYASSLVNGAGVVTGYKISDGTPSIHLLPSAAGALAASRNDQYLAATYAGKIRIWKLQ
jgi:hypothetical protein